MMDAGHAVALAQGMLMERYGLDETRALRMLTWLAQQNQVELSDVARHFTTRSTAPLPSSVQECRAG